MGRDTAVIVTVWKGFVRVWDLEFLQTSSTQVHLLILQQQMIENINKWTLHVQTQVLSQYNVTQVCQDGRVDTGEPGSHATASRTPRDADWFDWIGWIDWISWIDWIDWVEGLGLGVTWFASTAHSRGGLEDLLAGNASLCSQLNKKGDLRHVSWFAIVCLYSPLTWGAGGLARRQRTSVCASSLTKKRATSDMSAGLAMCRSRQGSFILFHLNFHPRPPLT